MRQGGQPSGAHTSKNPVSGLHSVAVGSGLTSAIAGSSAHFMVHGCDHAGRPILPMGLLASVLVVDIRGPGKVDGERVRVESMADGTARVWYTPPVSGTYRLKLAIKETLGTARLEALPGSPYIIEVAPSAHLTPRGERGGGGGAADGRGGAMASKPSPKACLHGCASSPSTLQAAVATVSSTEGARRRSKGGEGTSGPPVR